MKYKEIIKKMDELKNLLLDADKPISWIFDSEIYFHNDELYITTENSCNVKHIDNVCYSVLKQNHKTINAQEIEMGKLNAEIDRLKHLIYIK